MNNKDVGFFEDLESLIGSRKPSTVSHSYDNVLRVKETSPKEAKSKKESSKSLLTLLSDRPTTNPCFGCPYESKRHLITGVGDLSKACLLVVIEKVTEVDIINGSMIKSDKYRKFLALFLKEGFKEEDIYWTALSRCSAVENLDALKHCSNYLRKEVLAPTIKCILVLGVRPMQILIDKGLSTIFKNRGKIYDLLGKPCIVSTERIE